MSKRIRDSYRYEEAQKGLMNIKTDLKARFDHNKVRAREREINFTINLGIKGGRKTV